jgi:hypothetical protein
LPKYHLTLIVPVLPVTIIPLVESMVAITVKANSVPIAMPRGGTSSSNFKDGPTPVVDPNTAIGYPPRLTVGATGIGKSLDEPYWPIGWNTH